MKMIKLSVYQDGGHLSFEPYDADCCADFTATVPAERYRTYRRLKDALACAEQELCGPVNCNLERIEYDWSTFGKL